MSAVMVIHMDVSDDGWMRPYFQFVPALLQEYGAVQLAGSRTIRVLEGDVPAPDRIAVIRFPSADHIERFMADARYQPYRALRKNGSTAAIYIFEDKSAAGTLA